MHRSCNRNVPPFAAVVYLVALALMAAPRAANVVPDWTLADADGNDVNFFRDAAGRPAVMLFWATWCPYCRKLMPHLERLRRELAPAGVAFYALNIWEDGDPVTHMRENGYGFRLLLAADDVAQAYGVRGTPAVIAVDGERRVIYVRTSGTAPEQVASDLRRALMRATPSADERAPGA